MEIDVLSLIPKHWIVEELDNNLIKIDYNGIGASKRKSVVLPKSISVTEDFISGIAMYLGDGKLAKDGHLSYASKDIDIMRHALSFFKLINQHTSDLSFCINYRDYLNLDEWATKLSIPKERIKTYKRERSRHPAMTLQLSSMTLRELFESIINETMKIDFVNNESLRRAFLKGIFAAEGCVCVQRAEKPVPYLNYVSLSFHSEEQDLITLCQKLLSAEGIRTRLYPRKKCKSIDIITSNWNNFWKLWQIGIFDLCERKKKVFLETAKVLNVNCLVKEPLRSELFSKPKLSQKKLAEKLGTYQGSICRMAQGKFYVTVEQILELCKLSEVPLSEVRNNLKDIRVGCIFPLNNLDFLNFMIQLKSN